MTAPSFREVLTGPGSAPRRRALVAALLGWMLDGMDVMLYAFALGAIRREFGLSAAGAGALASVTLLTSALGGGLLGVLADQFGRARVLVWSILLYSVCTAATASAHTLAELVLWRALVGLGLGGEWSAGAVLVAESFPAAHRGKAIGLVQSGWAIGYVLAALLSAVVLPRYGWRPLFVLGLLPALLAAWVRRAVEEPEVWRRAQAGGPGSTSAPGPGSGAVPLSRLLSPPLRRRAVVATLLTTCLLVAYWGLFTWVPSYLAAPVREGGAGLDAVRSLGFIVPMQAGAFLGYTLFGVLADRLGRRPVFVAFVLGAAVAVPAFALAGARPGLLWLLSPVVGFCGHGYFSVFGALLAELFPSEIRASAQGICYNAGRAVSAVSPALVGALAARFGLGAALGATAGLYVAGALLMRCLPETRGQDLAG